MNSRLNVPSTHEGHFHLNGFGIETAIILTGPYGFEPSSVLKNVSIISTAPQEEMVNSVDHNPL